MADSNSSSDQIVIKKYANRRLYNTDSSSYVTLEDLAEMVKADKDFVVQDAKSGTDITHSVLTQIIFDQESKGENLLPIGFLRQLISFYDNSMKGLVPSYLEFSLESLMKEQEKFGHQLTESWGKNPFDAMQDQVKTNMAVFEQALATFTPFANAPASPPPDPTAGPDTAEDTADDLGELKNQLSEMQSRLDALAKGRSK